MLLWIVIILLVVLLIAALPTWGYSSGWGLGYFPSGVLAVIAILLLVLLLVGVV
jgi:hypothetical protein